MPTAAVRTTLGAGGVVEVRGFGRGLDMKLAGRNLSSWRRIRHRMAHVDRDAPGCVHRGSYDARLDKTAAARRRESSRMEADGRAVWEGSRAERTFCGVEARPRTRSGESGRVSDVDTEGHAPRQKVVGDKVRRAVRAKCPYVDCLGRQD